MLLLKVPFLKAPFLLCLLLAGAGGMATFAGGLVMAPSLYVSKFGELDYFAITP
jgi:hypothetical protein